MFGQLQRRKLKALANALALLLLGVVGVAFSGCGKSDPDGVVTITFTIHANNEGAVLIHECIEEFEAENPGIRVRLVHLVSKYEQVLLTMMAGGRGPDVFMMTPHVMESYVSKGILMPLDDLVEESDVIDLDNYFPQTVDAYRFDGLHFGQGELYGLCKDWSPDRLVFYNKTLFDEAGIPHPTADWTREEFVEIAKRLTVRDNRGRTLQYGVYNNCEPMQWIAQSGGSLFTEDMTQAALDSPEALDGLRFSADLITRHRVAPGMGDAAQTGTENVMFETGRVAMVFYGMWMVPILQRNVRDFDWGVVTPPRHVRDVYTCMAMAGYGINARTNHPEEAWKFFEFMAGPRGQQKHARMGWNIPSDRNIAHGPDFRDNPDLPSDVVEVFLSALPRTELIQINPFVLRGEMDMFFRPQWDLVLLGERSVEDAMARANRDLNRAIRANIAIMRPELLESLP